MSAASARFGSSSLHSNSGPD